jgi:hypothetical protein
MKPSQNVGICYAFVDADDRHAGTFLQPRDKVLANKAGGTGDEDACHS